MERFLSYKIYETEKWPIQVVLYDSNGKRLVSDYCPHEGYIDELVDRLTSIAERHKGRKAASFIAIKREVIKSGILPK